jgi:hypothetical protein
MSHSSTRLASGCTFPVHRVECLLPLPVPYSASVPHDIATLSTFSSFNYRPSLDSADLDRFFFVRRCSVRLPLSGPSVIRSQITKSTRPSPSFDLQLFALVGLLKTTFLNSPHSDHFDRSISINIFVNLFSIPPTFSSSLSPSPRP